MEYTQTSVDNVFNLAFGDYDEETDGINDKIVTNNGDSQKVLATVTSTVYAFTGRYPKAWVHATGSTMVRTRPYRMGITNNLAEIAEDFHVFGLREKRWEKFEKSFEYEAFIVTRKNKKLDL